MISDRDKCELNWYKEIFTKTQEELKQYVLNFVEEYYPKEQIRNKQAFIYVNNPEANVMLIAHLDTVFDTPPFKELIFYDPEAMCMWSPMGLGADDRAGIIMILDIIKHGYRPSLLFTTDEEIGGRGSCAFVSSPIYGTAPDNIGYIIQLDRQGVDDAVFYDCDNRDFVDYIENVGFYETDGIFSDISIICPYWEVAGVNLSVGYFQEHSKTEMLFLGPWMKTEAKVMSLLEMPEIYFKYIPATIKLPKGVKFVGGRFIKCDDPEVKNDFDF